MSRAADVGPSEMILGAGDAIHIQVYQNPDLTLDTRLSESGVITFPLIGAIKLSGETLSSAQDKLALALKSGGFVQQPQVNMSLVQVRANQISVLGQVTRPGRYPIESPNTRVIDILTTAGGIAPGGAESVILIGQRGGTKFRKEMDIAGLFLDSKSAEDATVAGGDMIFVPRAPVFYIYGEVQHPGVYRLERAMTVRHALAQGGGPGPRGSENKLSLHRKVNGHTAQSTPALSDSVMADDIIIVKESLF